MFKKKTFYYLGHGIIHRDAKSFSWSHFSGEVHGAPQVMSLRKIGVDFYCRTPLPEVCP